MSFSTSGHQKKAARMARSHAVFERYEQEESLETVFFVKGEHVGVLDIKDSTMGWEVYKDRQLSQHLDWYHPECFPEYAEARQLMNPTAFASMLIENGWSLWE